MSKVRQCIKVVGVQEAIAIINRVHMDELKASETFKADFKRRFKNPAVGPIKEHVEPRRGKICSGCLSSIRARAEEIESLSVIPSAVPATASI